MDIIYGEPGTDEDKINSFIMGRMYPICDEFTIANGIGEDLDMHILKYFAERLCAIGEYEPDHLADIVREAASQFKQDLEEAMAEDVPTPAPAPPKRNHLRLV